MYICVLIDRRVNVTMLDQQLIQTEFEFCVFLISVPKHERRKENTQNEQT